MNTALLHYVADFVDGASETVCGLPLHGFDARPDTDKYTMGLVALDRITCRRCVEGIPTRRLGVVPEGWPHPDDTPTVRISQTPVPLTLRVKTGWDFEGACRALAELVSYLELPAGVLIMPTATPGADNP